MAREVALWGVGAGTVTGRFAAADDGTPLRPPLGVPLEELVGVTMADPMLSGHEAYPNWVGGSRDTSYGSLLYPSSS